MKNFRKILALVLSLVMTLSLVACGGSGDNTAPVINGVADQTLEAGSEFDAFAGVTAEDKEDGDISAMITVEATPALDFKNGKATPATAGSYELVYSVTDKGGETVEAYATLTVTKQTGDATVLYAFDFSDQTVDAKGWTAKVAEGVAATGELKQGAFVFDITNPGAGDGDIQLVLPGMAVKAADYKVKIWAKSTANTYCHILARDEQAEGWSTFGGAFNVVIGQEVSPLELNFTASGEGSTELMLNLGKITPNPENPADTTPENFTVTIDKIEIYEITGEEFQTPVYSNDFSAADASSLIVSAGDGASASASFDGKSGKITIDSYPTEGGVWSIKADIALPGVTIEQGTVIFQYGGKPYSCLELGGLGQFKLVFQNYSLKKIAEPEIVNNGFESFQTWTESSMKPLNREDTKEAMILTSDNEPGDWWKVKLENNFKLEPGKTYEAVYTFTSDADGDIKFGTNEKVTCLTGDVYHVVAGENRFAVTFTAQADAYTCLELGGLGKFVLSFTEITLTEAEKPAEPDPEPDQPGEHTHKFVSGKCECGLENGFAHVSTWTEGSLTPVVREDSEDSMTLISANAPGDWWKVKLEWPLAVTEGKTYEATFRFTSDVAGTIKYSVNGAAFLDSQDYSVSVGENIFAIRFTAGAENYSCLELGGLGNFKLTFTEISLKELEPAEHSHSFVNGKCECGETNGFAGVSVWTEGSLTPVVREDSEDTMTMISTNAPGDWWKVKLEWPLAVTEGKTYEATFRFSSNAAGMIKYSVNGAAFLDSQDYSVSVGENIFAIRFTAGAENYSCLELGGLGQFRLTFTEISLKELEPAEHSHSFVNGKCECGKTNGFAGVSVWTEGSLTPVTREDSENSMTMISTNAPGDWWKVKLEWPLAVTEGKTYEATFRFTSDVAGMIKYSVNGAAFLDSQDYSVSVGENTFTVRFTAGAENYSCLELGGLGNFKLTFTEISLKELEPAA